MSFQCLWSPLNEKSVINNITVLYLVSCFPLAVCRISSLSLSFSGLSMCLGVFLFVFIAWEFIEFWGLWINVIHQIWKFSSHYLLKWFLLFSFSHLLLRLPLHAFCYA